MKHLRDNVGPAIGMRRGFTMVEILTVIAVMAILMSVASVGIQKIDRGQATTSALAVTEALFDEARSVAVGRGTRARVLVHNELDDSNEDDRVRYLRYLAVAAWDEDSSSWEVVSRGTLLPSGVYFDADYSSDGASRVSGIGTYGTTTIRLPGADKAAKNCYYYEFNGEGICVDGDSAGADPGAAFVLVSGVRLSGRDEIKTRGNNRTGFVIWRNGRTSLYRNPDQI